MSGYTSTEHMAFCAQGRSKGPELTFSRAWQQAPMPTVDTPRPFLALYLSLSPLDNPLKAGLPQGHSHGLAAWPLPCGRPFPPTPPAQTPTPLTISPSGCL